MPTLTFDKRLFMHRIKARRIDLGLTQPELGELIGMPPAMISHYENGRQLPTFLNSIRLAEGLGLSLDYMTGRSHDPRK